MLDQVSTILGLGFLFCKIQIRMTTYWEDEAWTAVKVFNMRLSSESAVSKRLSAFMRQTCATWTKMNKKILDFKA